jgi:hypothetical protein
MRYFGSWWERLRRGELAPTLVVAALTLGLALGHAEQILRHLAGAGSNYWS